MCVVEATEDWAVYSVVGGGVGRQAEAFVLRPPTSQKNGGAIARREKEARCTHDVNAVFE